MGKTITYGGLDVHKKTISVALAEGGLRGEARFMGTIPDTAGALTNLAMRLSRKGGELRFCYEAGFGRPGTMAGSQLSTIASKAASCGASS